MAVHVCESILRLGLGLCVEVTLKVICAAGQFALQFSPQFQLSGRLSVFVVTDPPLCFI